MNITVNSTALAQELRLINQVVASKPSLPILNNVLMRADEHLYLYATDLEVGFSTACRALVEAPGMVTLPAKRLLDLVEQLPDADVQLTFEGKVVTIAFGSFRSRLQTMPAEDFPAPPPIAANPTTLSTQMLQSMVRRVRYAISEKSKYNMRGALLTLTENAAGLVATDGKRLSLATMPHANGSSLEIILPTKTLDSLMIFDTHEILFSKSDQHLFFVADHRLLLSRVIDGQFPNYQSIIPKGGPINVVVQRTVLAAALRRVGVVSDDSRLVYLVLDANTLEISARTADIGEAHEQLPVAYEEPSLKICINGNFLLDFLDAAEAPSISLVFKDKKTPLLVTDGQNFINIIMLVRA